MAAEIDNQYCVVLEDTLQTDLLWSNNNRILGSKRVVFPMVIGAVAWSKANTQKSTAYDRTAREWKEIDVPIKYNEKVGTFTVPQENSIQTFSIKVRFLGETFGVVNQEQLQEAAENERRHTRNKHDTNQTVSIQDAKRRSEAAEMAEESAETDDLVSRASVADQEDAKLRRKETREERDAEIDELRYKNMQSHRKDPVEQDERAARKLENDQRKEDAETERLERDAQAHEELLIETKKGVEAQKLKDKRQADLDAINKKPGWFSRGNKTEKTKQQDTEGNKSGFLSRGMGMFKRSPAAVSSDASKVKPKVAKPTDVKSKKPSQKALEAGWDTTPLPVDIPPPKTILPRTPRTNSASSRTRPPTAAVTAHQRNTESAGGAPASARPGSRVSNGKDSIKSSNNHVDQGDAANTAFDESWAEQQYDDLHHSKRNQTIFARTSGTVKSSDGLIEEEPSSDEDDPVQPSRGVGQTTRQNSTQSLASRGRSASLRRLGDGSASTTPRSREGRSAAGSRPSVENRTTASSRSRTPVRDPSSSRPAARLASADDIIIEPAFDKQSPRPLPSSQVPSAGIASHTSETSTRPPTKYDHFSQPVQDSNSLAVPDDADGDFELQGSVKKKRTLSKKGHDQLKSLYMYDNPKPSTPALPAKTTFAPVTGHTSNRKQVETRAVPLKPVGRYSLNEITQVKTYAEKEAARQQREREQMQDQFAHLHQNP